MLAGAIPINHQGLDQAAVEAPNAVAFLRARLVDSGVLVNAIAPALTETELFREMTPEHIALARSKIPMGRTLRVPEAAAMVAWIVSPGCSFTTGFVFDLTGGRATY